MQHIGKHVKQNKIIAKPYRAIRLLSGFPDVDMMKLAWTVTPYTMLSIPRLFELYKAAFCLENEGIKGSFVECGVWNGGSAGMMGAAVKANKHRHIWLFDSWEGLPEPSACDITFAGEPGKKGMAHGSEDRVKVILFEKIGLNNKLVHLSKGWFTDTIINQKDNIGKIALLHLDCDWYESVNFCLEELYDQVVPNGFIFIDDYVYWKGCKRAVDDFIERRGLSIVLTSTGTAVHFRK